VVASTRKSQAALAHLPTYFVANLRLVLDVEVQAGNHTAALYSRPGLWALIDRLGQLRRLRARDCAWATRGDTRAEEHGWITCSNSSRAQSAQADPRRFRARGLDRSRQAGRRAGGAAFKRLDAHAAGHRAAPAGQGELALENRGGAANWNSPSWRRSNGPVYEYAVLVTSLASGADAGQHYRDRADAENNFDEMKNQWLGGYTTTI